MAAHYGSPAYWLDPDLPDELIATALDTLEAMQHGR